jgi:hypothetical protein
MRICPPTPLFAKEKGKLFKYIEGKAKFVSSYEVAFCVFFPWQNFDQNKIQKFKNKMYFERVSITTNEPKDFLYLWTDFPPGTLSFV